MYYYQLCNAYWDNSYKDIPLFSNVEEILNYLKNNSTFNESYFKKCNFKYDGCLETEIYVKQEDYTSNMFTFANNYLVIKNDNNTYLFYFVNDIEYDNAQILKLKLELDVITTFNHRLRYNNCLINRGMLNRFKKNSDNTYSFNFDKDSLLHNQEENINELPKYLSKIEKLNSNYEDLERFISDCGKDLYFLQLAIGKNGIKETSKEVTSLLCDNDFRLQELNNDTIVKNQKMFNSSKVGNTNLNEYTTIFVPIFKNEFSFKVRTEITIKWSDNTTTVFSKELIANKNTSLETYKNLNNGTTNIYESKVSKTNIFRELLDFQSKQIKNLDLRYNEIYDSVISKSNIYYEKIKLNITHSYDVEKKLFNYFQNITIDLSLITNLVNHKSKLTQVLGGLCSCLWTNLNNQTTPYRTNTGGSFENCKNTLDLTLLTQSTIPVLYTLYTSLVTGNNVINICDFGYSLSSDITSYNLVFTKNCNTIQEYNFTNPIYKSFSLEDIKVNSNNKEYEPKLNIQQVKHFEISSGSYNTFTYDYTKVSKDCIIKYIDNSILGVNRTAMFLSDNNLYKYNGSIPNGLIEAEDFSIPITENQLTTYLSNNKNYWLQASTNIITNVGRSLFSGQPSQIISRGASAVSELINKGLSLDNMKNAPESLRGSNGNYGYYIDIGSLCPQVLHYDSLESDKNKLSNYFLMYGYTVNKIDDITNYINNRKYWNYIECDINTITDVDNLVSYKYMVSNKIKEKIKEIFKNGIRFWNNELSQPNYELPNYERSLN